MQSLVYVVVGLVGYAALGSDVDLDLFKIYEAGLGLLHIFHIYIYIHTYMYVYIYIAYKSDFNFQSAKQFIQVGGPVYDS